MERIIINVENLSVPAELYDTPTAKAVFEALPVEGIANVWGDEIYFEKHSLKLPAKFDAASI